MLFAALAAPAASAQFIPEDGDAGSTLSTAQMVPLPCEEMPGISGETLGDDTDLFRCTALRSGILYNSNFNSFSDWEQQVIVDVARSTYELGFMEPTNVRVRTKGAVLPGQTYLVGTAPTNSRVLFPAQASEPTLVTDVTVPVGEYRHEMYFRETPRVERLPRQDIACAAQAVAVNLDDLDLLLHEMEVGVNQRLWLRVQIDRPDRFGFHIESSQPLSAFVIFTATNDVIWAEFTDEDDPVSRDLAPVFHHGELAGDVSGEYLIGAFIGPRANLDLETLCYVSEPTGWYVKRGDAMMIVTGGGADITALAATAHPQGGVDVQFQATEQRTFGYRVDALDAAGALVVRDTLRSTTWSGGASYTATFFQGQLPSGPLRVRVTPLGRGSYEDWLPIEADARESDLFVAADGGLAAVRDALTLTRRGANPARTTAEVALTLRAPGEVALAVVDLLGRTVLAPIRRAYPAGESAVAFDVSGLPAGLYVVRATGRRGETAALRVVVQ